MAARKSMKNLLPGFKKFLSPSLKEQFGGLRSMTISAVNNQRPEESSALDVDRSARQAPVVIPVDLPSETWDPLFTTRRLNNLFNMIDVFSSPLLGVNAAAPLVGISDVRGSGARKPWDVLEDKDTLRLRVDMPGLFKENVSIRVEGNSIVIKGEAQTDVELDGSGRRYSSRIEFPANVYKLDQIKAEMKNGVLKITFPKVKEEELKNVTNVQIE